MTMNKITVRSQHLLEVLQSGMSEGGKILLIHLLFVSEEDIDHMGDGAALEVARLCGLGAAEINEVDAFCESSLQDYVLSVARRIIDKP